MDTSPIPDNLNNNKQPTNVEQSTNKAEKRQEVYNKYTRWMWGIYITGVFCVALLFFGIANGLLGTLPTFIQLESPTSALSSEVYARDGALLGKFFVEDRSNVNFDELPKNLVNALVATEDVRFFKHAGIDLRALGRAIYAFVRGKNDGGGSTLSQQLAKNLFHEKPTSNLGRVKQKLKEWVIAVMLERSYTKEEILTMYLNVVSFSNNAHGIKSASLVYFNTLPDSLKVQESAILVGMLKANTRYNPVRNPENAKERRNVVLAQMEKYDYLEEAETDSLQALDIVLDLKKVSHDEGLATYFRDYVKKFVKAWSKRNVKVGGQTYDIHRDGLKIYTTLDANLQTLAEQAVTEHMINLQQSFNQHWGDKEPWRDVPKVSKKQSPIWAGTNGLLFRGIEDSDRYKNMKQANIPMEDIKDSFNVPTKMSVYAYDFENNVKTSIDTVLTPIDSIKYYARFLHASFLVTDPYSGEILAYVGDVDHKQFKFDNVTAKHQVGSTFKPFVYTLAIENGWTPCTKVPNVPVVFEDYDNWSPRNAGSYMDGQKVPLTKGLAFSINRVTARLMKQLSIAPVIELARKMGVENHIDEVPAICLGVADLTLYEMVGAYSTFANKGLHTKPISVRRIEDKNGNVLEEFTPIKSEVINDQVAYAVLHLLQQVSLYGTAGRLRWKYGLEGEIAGKTGTTNDNSDGWFIGLTPQLAGGAWVGGSEKAIRFRNTRLGSGANMALPIWAKFMQKVYTYDSIKYNNKALFERPRYMGIELDCSKYVDPVAPVTVTDSSGVITPVPGQATEKVFDASYDPDSEFDQ